MPYPTTVLRTVLSRDNTLPAVIHCVNGDLFILGSGGSCLLTRHLPARTAQAVAAHDRFLRWRRVTGRGALRLLPSVLRQTTWTPRTGRCTPFYSSRSMDKFPWSIWSRRASLVAPRDTGWQALQFIVYAFTTSSSN